jgi:hypothetical protein
VDLSNQAMTIHFLITICVAGGIGKIEVSLKEVNEAEKNTAYLCKAEVLHR